MKINDKLYTLVSGLLMTTILLSPSISEAKTSENGEKQKYFTLADAPSVKNYNKFVMERMDTPYQTNNKKSEWSYEEWRLVLHNHIKPTVVDLMKKRVLTNYKIMGSDNYKELINDSELMLREMSLYKYWLVGEKYFPNEPNFKVAICKYGIDIDALSYKDIKKCDETFQLDPKKHFIMADEIESGKNIASYQATEEDKESFENVLKLGRIEINKLEKAKSNSKKK